MTIPSLNATFLDQSPSLMSPPHEIQVEEWALRTKEFEMTVSRPRQVLVQVSLNAYGRMLLSERTGYWSHVGWT